MGYTKTQQARLLAGLCYSCGTERTGDGFTKHRCADCAEKNRAARRLARKADRPRYLATLEKERIAKTERQAAQKAAGICLLCHKPRKRLGATTRLCAVCAQKDRARCAAYQQKKRNKAAGFVEGDGRNIKKWPMGAAARGRREGGVYNLSVWLDRDSYDGLIALRQRYRDAETRAGREYQTHQLSRLVREVILRYEPSRVGIEPRKFRLLNGQVAHLSLDGRTRAVLERQAARSFDGNKSATLRAMLAGCQGIRRAFTGRAGMRGR